jgi:protocatechuate 3,4-dioxygenase beta subunit
MQRPPAPAAVTPAAARDPGAILDARRAAHAQGAARDRTPAAASGHVRDARSHAAIAGAVVRLTPALFLGARDDASGAAAPPLHVRTDAQGAWSLAVVPPGRYRLAASAPGYLPGELVDVLVRPSTPRADLDLALVAGGLALTGTVTDVGGGAVAAALVEARLVSGTSLIGGGTPIAALTDEHGGYRLDLADGNYQVTASHADYVEGTRWLTLHGGAATLDFVLTPGASVQGVVLRRSDRQPVGGALVIAGGGHDTMENMGDLRKAARMIGAGGVVADAQGRFVVRGLGSGTVLLKAYARGASSREATLVDLGVGEEREGVEILVDESRTISGYVVRQGHEQDGLPEVLVGGVQLKGGFAPTIFDETDETGYFEILGLLPGRYGLVAAKDGLLPSVMQKFVDVSDKDVEDVLLFVDLGATLRGRVEPPTAATLSLEVQEKDIGLANVLGLVGATLAHGRAAPEDGRFEMKSVPQGAFQLVARADDGRTGKLAVVVRLDDQGDLVVKLEPRASIAGKVVDANGSPVGGVEVDVSRQETGGRGDQRIDLGELTRGNARTRADGSFEAVGLEAGKYGFGVDDGDGHLDWAPGAEAEEVELAAGEQRRGVLLKVESRSGVIRGRVVGEDGQPVGDAWVSASRGDAHVFDPSAGDAPAGGAGKDEEAPEASGWGDGGAHPVLTGADGRFQLERLRDRTYDLSADANGTRGFKRGVEPGADVTITLRALATLSGKVSVAGGAPVTDFKVSLEGPVQQSKQVVGADGRYELTRLDAGTYRVQVTSDAGAGKAEASVKAGQAATCDVTLDAWGEVSGVVVDALTGKPVSGLHVVADSEEFENGGEQAVGLFTGGGPTTDAQGRFSVGKLGPGRGHLVVISSGLLSGIDTVLNQAFELAPGEKKDLGTLQANLRARVDEDKERGDLGFDTGTDEHGLKVTAVDAGGPAAALLQPGDQIVTLEGRDVAVIGPATASQLLSPPYLRPGMTLHLGVSRGGAAATEVTIVARARPATPVP